MFSAFFPPIHHGGKNCTLLIIHLDFLSHTAREEVEGGRKREKEKRKKKRTREGAEKD